MPIAEEDPLRVDRVIDGQQVQSVSWFNGLRVDLDLGCSSGSGRRKPANTTLAHKVTLRCSASCE